MQKHIQKRFLAIFLSFSMMISLCSGLNLAVSAGSGTLYNFSNLGSSNSGGTGYTKVGTYFKVDNNLSFAASPSAATPSGSNTAIYQNDTATNTVDYYSENSYTETIYAEGTTACKTFTFQDLGLSCFKVSGYTYSFYSFVIAFYDASGGLIQSDTLGASSTSISQTSITQLSSLYPSHGTWNVSNVASVSITFRLLHNPVEEGYPIPFTGAANLNLENITVNNISNTVNTYTIGSLSNQTLTELTAGYTSGSQESKSITIAKTGTGDLENLKTALSGTNAVSFTVTQPTATTLNSTTSSTTFTVKAIDGLAEGTYTTTVTVSATNMTSVTFTVTQVVTAASGTEADAWDGTTATSFASGDGLSAATAYEIATAEQLAYMASVINGSATNASYTSKYYKLTADIDLTNRQWTPIGSLNYAFNGLFDGNDHKVSNFKIGTSASPSLLDFIGLFGNTGSTFTDVQIKNVGVENFEFYSGYPTTGTSSAKVGGLVGYVKGIVTKCYATNGIIVCSATNTWAGGLIGRANPATVSYCYANANIAGINGTDTAGTSTTQYTILGGLIGRAQNSSAITISNCYATGSLTAGTDSKVGGLVGLLSTTSSSGINNCYAATTVSGGIRSDVGGLVGKNAAGTVTNGYWNSEITATGVGINSGTNNSLGKTTTYMKTIDTNTTPNFVNDLGSTVWKMDSQTKNQGYPVLIGVGVGKSLLTYTAASIANQTLMGLTAGYTAGTQENKSITISKTGTGDLLNVAVALSGTNEGSFTVTQPVSTTLNSTTSSTTFTVKAIDGLAVGTYTATVTVSATNMTAVAFTVTQVVSNTAPTFVGSTTTLTVDEDSTNQDIKSPLHVSDSDSSQTLTWSQKTAPNHGTLSFSSATASSGSTDIVPGGTITYTPTADYSGTDSFTVQVYDGTATATRTISVTINDKTAPTGTITQGENNWATFFNGITFGLFFKETVNVTISAADGAGSGVKSIQYYKTATAYTELSQVQAITGWSSPSATMPLTLPLTPADAEKFVIYAKITDNAGNVTYINSNGMEFDLQGPTISTNYTKDATSMEVTVTDSGSGVKAVTYTVNGSSVQNAILINGKFTISSLVDGKYDVVITAQDTLGNEKSLTVNVVSVYTVTFKLFDGDTGTALKTEAVEYGSAATAPTNTTRTGFAFKSWDKSFNSITSDITVNATWDIGNITVTPYTGVFDGSAHNAVTVTGTLTGDAITYNTNGTDFSSTCPQYTNADSYPVYVKVARTGYTTWESGLKTAVIDRAAGIITITSDISKTYDGIPALNPSVTKNGGGAVTYTYYNDNAGSVGTSLSNAPSAAGTYWVKGVMAQDTNYTTAEAARKFTIGLAAITGSVSILQTILTGTTVTADISGALPAGVTFGYQWKLNGIAIPSATGSSYAVQETDYGKTLIVVLTANGNFTGSITSNGVIIGETVVPTGEIKQGINSWKNFWNGITFGLFFKDTVTITISSDDKGGSGVAKTEYYKSDKELKTVEEVQTITNWQSYPLSGLPLTPTDAEKFVIYAKIIDNAGNVAYMNSTGITFDLTGPSITSDYTKDATSMEVTVTDSGSGVKTVTYNVNGGGVRNATLTNGKFTISSLAEGKYDVVITSQDTLGNEKSVTVNVVSVYTVTFKLFDGDTGTALKTEAVEYGSAATAPTDLTRTGFTFKGWDKGLNNITADTTINATWDISGITVTPYSGIYDEVLHNAVTVTGTLSDDNVTYSTDGSFFSTDCPQYTNANSYPVYVKVARDGYTTWESGLKTAVIHRTDGIITIPTDLSKTYDGSAVLNPSVNKNGGGAVTYTYYNDDAGSIGASLSNTPSAAGTYWVKAAMAQDTNYTAAEATRKFTIGLAAITGSVSIPQTILTGSTVTADITGVLPAGVIVAYQWKLNGIMILNATSSSYAVQETDYGKTLIVVLTAYGNFTGNIESNGVTIDETVAPTGIIKQEDNTWAKFWNGITFGLFFKETVNVTIMAEDMGGSGVAKTEYYKSDKEMKTVGEVQAITNWQPYPSSGLSFTPTDAEKFVIYAKITDSAGNVSYINSNGMEFDLTGPTVSTDYTKDATSMDVTVTDSGSGVKTVTYIVNSGNAQTATLDANGKFTISSLVEGKYDVIITAQDTLGNEKNLTVNVVSVYTVTYKLFDGDTGIALKTETVEYGSAATAPIDLSRTGFTFKDWDKSFNNITADTIVNATWDISGITVTPYTGTFDGIAHDAITVTGTLTGDTITYSINGTDFTETCLQYTNAGSYPMYVKVARTGYATWESGLKTAVVDQKAITADMIANIPSAEYTAQPITPLPEVKYGTIVLIKDTDYTVSYTNNTEIGLANVNINGKGNYTGAAAKIFAIYTKNTSVEIKDDQTPPVVVEGLDTLYEDDTIYTQEDQQIEQNGGSVKIELSVQLKTDITKDETKIEKIATDKTIGVYLDLSLFKTVTMAGEENGTTTTISRLNDLLTIVVPIPDTIKGKKGIAMYRVHDGVAAIIPIGKDNAVDGEYCTVDADSITLFVRNFSTYAIGYDNKTTDSNVDNPKSGNTVPVLPVTGMLIGFVGVIGVTFTRRGKRVEL